MVGHLDFVWNYHGFGLRFLVGDEFLRCCVACGTRCDRYARCLSGQTRTSLFLDQIFESLASVLEPIGYLINIGSCIVAYGQLLLARWRLVLLPEGIHQPQSFLVQIVLDLAGDLLGGAWILHAYPVHSDGIQFFKSIWRLDVIPRIVPYIFQLLEPATRQDPQVELLDGLMHLLMSSTGRMQMNQGSGNVQVLSWVIMALNECTETLKFANVYVAYIWQPRVGLPLLCDVLRSTLAGLLASQLPVALPLVLPFGSLFFFACLVARLEGLLAHFVDFVMVHVG